MIDNLVPVKISSAWANVRFMCSEEYIRTVCHGSCCQGSDKILISLLPCEVEFQERAGYPTKDGLLLPDATTKICPHKKEFGLCDLHYTENKPLGCILSPFTINRNNTVIIRNRYSRMRCHGSGTPAYICFRESLNRMFGFKEAQRVCDHLASGGGDVIAYMDVGLHDSMIYLDTLKHTEEAE